LHHTEEISANVALTCRYYGIGRQMFYKWKLPTKLTAQTVSATGHVDPVR
jgi:hypothetical protein